MNGEENPPAGPLNKAELDIRKSSRLNPAKRVLGQEEVDVDEEESVDEGEADLSSDEESEDLSADEMVPKLAEKGKLKGEVSALLVEVEEELDYEEEGGDEAEMEQVVKCLKELRFNLMSKIGQLVNFQARYLQGFAQ